jgi:hypothetical protein
MWYAITLLITVSPIVLGGGLFLGEYVREEFYKYPLYPDSDS